MKNNYKVSERLEKHLSTNASKRRNGAWLPAVYSESDDALRAEIEDLLGSTSPSGYMSEECGWAFGREDVEDYLSAETVEAIFGAKRRMPNLTI